MEQDKSPQSANGHTARAAQVTEAKARQRENALLRSKTDIRRTSGASTENAQSEVTERPPALYQVPQINVPEDLHGAAKLIHGELTKIANSQSVLLSLWEKLKGQVASKDSITFTKQINFVMDPYVNGTTGWNCVPQYAQMVSDSMDNAPWGWAMVSGIADAPNPYGTVLTISSGGTYSLTVPEAAANPNYWLQQIMIDTSNQIFTRTATNGAGWTSWLVVATNITIERMRAQFKREVYAELMELNAGIVVPVVMNGSHNES